jgi:hypothetical protein
MFMVQSARPHPNTSLKLGQPEDKLLRVIGRCPYATAEQVTRLVYGRGSLTYVMDKLSKLTEAGYVVRAGRTYGIKSVYVLSTKGSRYVSEQGGDVKLSLQPSELAQKHLQFLLHTMAVNDYLISLELLCRSYPQFRIATTLHDLELKHQPVKVTLADGTKTSVIPDSWIELHIANRWRECFTVEIDRGFIEQKRWRKKVRALVAFAKGPYQEAFKTTSLRITVNATPGDKRRDELLRWTEAELKSLNEEALASAFCFAGIAAHTVQPTQLWCSPVWYAPFAREPLTLLSLEEEARS